MATAQNLVVNILGNASQLSRTAKQAQADVRQLEMRVTASVGGIVRQFAGLAGLAGLSYFAQQSFSAIDANAKLADSLGTTTEKLTGLHHAGELSGVAINEINGALTRMSRRLEFAAQGGGAAIGTVRKLGLEVDRLKQMDPADAFAEIAEQIRQLPTQAEKGAAAFQLFGNSGAKLLPLFEAGADGIREMMTEAGQLGKTFSRVDAAKIEAANDSMLRLKQSVMGVGQQIAISTAPSVERLADYMQNLALQVQSAVDWMDKWGRYLAAAAIATTAYVGILKTVAAVKLLIAKRQMLIAALSGRSGIVKIAVGLAAFGASVVAVNTILAETDSGLQAVTSSARPAAAALAEFHDSLEAMASIDSQRSFLARFQTDSESVRKELLQLDQAIQSGLLKGSGSKEVDRIESAIIDKRSGVFSEIKTVRDELARLRGESTETEQKLRDMLAAGAPAREVERLRRLWEQRDAIKEQTQRQDEWNRKVEEGSRDLDQMAARMKESLKTDADRLRGELDQIRTLWLAGRLTSQEARQLDAQARDRFRKPVDGTSPLAPAGPNSALLAASQEGIEAFNRLFRPDDAGGTVEEQQRDLLVQIEKAQARQLQLQQQQARPIQLGAR